MKNPTKFRSLNLDTPRSRYDFPNLVQNSRKYSKHKPRHTCAKVVLGHLWYDSSPIDGFDQRCIIRDTTGCQVDQDSNLTLASHRLPTHPYYL